METTIERAIHSADMPYFLILRDMVQAKRISWEALGVLTYLLSKPDTWKLQPSDLKIRGTGRDRVYRVITELMDAHHIQRIRYTLQGRTIRVTYRVFEVPFPPEISSRMYWETGHPEPLPENQETDENALFPEKPDTDLPDTGNQYVREYREEETTENLSSPAGANCELSPANSEEASPNEAPAEASAMASATEEEQTRKSEGGPPPVRLTRYQQAGIAGQRREDPDQPATDPGVEAILAHPMVVLLMGKTGTRTLNKAHIRLLIQTIHYPEPDGMKKIGSLMDLWDKRPGFEDFVRDRVTQLLSFEPGMRMADILTHLRKVGLVPEPGTKKMPGFLEWAKRNIVVSTAAVGKNDAPLDDQGRPMVRVMNEEGVSRWASIDEVNGNATND